MTTPTLSAALVAAQAAVDPVIKEGWDKHGKRPFASHEDMILYGRKHLTAHGMALVPMGTSYQHLGDIGPKAKAHGIVTIRWKLIHASGEEMPIERQMIAVSHDGMALDKAVAAAQSYDLIYAIRDLLQVDRRMPGEVPVDERPDAPAYEPRQRAEQRGWGQAQDARPHRVAYDEIAERLDKARAHGLSSADAVAQEAARAARGQEPTTPFDEPNPDVLFGGFLDSIQNAPNESALDAAWSAASGPASEGLREDSMDVLAEAYRWRKIDFCRTPADFAACAAKIQKAFTGDARSRLIAHHTEVKAAVLSGKPAARAADPLPSPDEIPY